jgi:hypothetical protein
MRPDIQHRLRAEIARVMAKRQDQLTYDGIQEMSYLDIVVSGQGLKWLTLYAEGYEWKTNSVHVTVVVPGSAFHRPQDRYPEGNRSSLPGCCNIFTLTNRICTYFQVEITQNVSVHMRDIEVAIFRLYYKSCNIKLSIFHVCFRPTSSAD